MKKISLIIGLFLFFGLTSVQAQDEIIQLENVHVADSTFLIEEGVASYYGTRFHLRKTANGEVYDMEELTAAHKHLPFGTMLRVVNLKNEKEVWVRVNDRLPKSSKRVIDLSKGAARELEMIRDGVVPVRLEVPDQETIVSLIDYYQENKPEGMRLRLYPEPIEFLRPNIEMLELMLNLPSEMLLSRNN
ncbi:rare lipoprotein A [Belliella buryatensis]|uniref:Probable endolytic peptidoglycan transglycosylase RlpA n=1 Tax=Belliella buryatensis TaxID=1500549 RepID=A0A239ANB9_9BACT|nr:septal ring lytic transglycosylase RlpA family protein [Belliella buryatensis]SNR96473.1 rare lipoprotein A [Belliella buryatensis]